MAHLSFPVRVRVRVRVHVRVRVRVSSAHRTAGQQDRRSDGLLGTSDRGGVPSPWSRLAVGDRRLEKCSRTYRNVSRSKQNISKA